MSNSLFIGSLSWDATEEDLKAFFEGLDLGDGTTIEVVKTVIVRDKLKNNRSKGFGFVTFVSEEVASAVKNFLDSVDDSQKEIHGRALRADFAKDRDDSAPRRDFRN